jgi:mitochondrial fission protein ELM1
MVTPSRRTGPENEAILRNTLAGLPAIVWDGAGENPYFGYLGLADYVIATADSVSMITEAGATGKPVHVLPLAGGSKKFQRFQEAMVNSGITRPFTGALEKWSYPTRSDTEAAGQRIGQMLRERDLWE